MVGRGSSRATSLAALKNKFAHKIIFAFWLLLTLAACGWLQAQAPPDLKPQPLPKPQIPPDYKTHVLLLKSNVLEVLLSGDTWSQRQWPDSG